MSAVAYDPYKKVYQNVSRSIVYRKKMFSVFIHTDKAIYKGGDIIKFRLFAVDSETKPYLDNFPLRITDPNDEQRVPSKKKCKRGQMEGSYQLNENPAPGVWKIQFDGYGEVSETYLFLEIFSQIPEN